MKKTGFLFLGLISLALLTSCEKNDKIKPMNLNGATKVVKAPLIDMETWPEGECTLQTFDLIAGQHIYAGSVEAVIADNLDGVRSLFVKYETFGDCKLTEAHLFVGAPDAMIPAGNKGNPKIGHFPYFWEGGSKSEVVFTIALDDLKLGEDDCFKIAAHAVVICDGEEETAWARGSDLVFALKSYTVITDEIDGPKLVTGQAYPLPPAEWEERLIYYPLAQALTEEIQLVSHADGNVVVGKAIVREVVDGYVLEVTANDGLIVQTWLYVGPAAGFTPVHSAWNVFPDDPEVPLDPGVNPHIIPLDVTEILSGHEFDGSRWGWYIVYCPPVCEEI